MIKDYINCSYLNFLAEGLAVTGLSSSGLNGSSSSLMTAVGRFLFIGEPFTDDTGNVFFGEVAFDDLTGEVTIVGLVGDGCLVVDAFLGDLTGDLGSKECDDLDFTSDFVDLFSFCSGSKSSESITIGRLDGLKSLTKIKIEDRTLSS